MSVTRDQITIGMTPGDMRTCLLGVG